MNNNSALYKTLDVFTGWSEGYAYMTYKNAEDEVRQGKNYYIATFYTICQIGLLTSLLNKIALKVLVEPKIARFKRLMNAVYYLSIPFCLTAAMIKHDHTKNFIKSRKLPDVVVKFFGFAADHVGNLVRVGMVAIAVKHIALKNYFLGVSLLSGLAFQILDAKGFFPRKVSLFAETYFPTVSNLVFVFGSGIPLLARFKSVLSLSTEVPSINQLLHQKVDFCVRKIFQLEGMGPSLADYDAPLVNHKNFTYAQIVEILNHPHLSNCLNKESDYTLDYTDFEINPAHCSKSVFADHLPSDFEFEKFKTLYELTDWSTKSTLLFAKFIDDETFIEMLGEEFIGLREEEKASFSTQEFPLLHMDQRKNMFSWDKPNKFTAEQIQSFVDQRKKACRQMIFLLAQKKNVTVEELLATRFREKMTILVATLKGEIRVKGSQKDLDDSIKNCAQILYYLNTLDRGTQVVDREDILIKLVIEGGDYCARGIKRSSKEILPNIAQNRLSNFQNQPVFDPLKDYELKIRSALQEVRQREVENLYKRAIKDKSLAVLTDDVHGFDEYRLFLSLGFFPLTDYERREIDFFHMFSWWTWTRLRYEMLSSYSKRLEETVSEVGKIHFFPYFQHLINSNDKLTNAQKVEIIEMFTERNEGYWEAYDTERRFIALLYVMLGVIRKRK